MNKDKGLEKELREAGIPSGGHQPFMLPEQDARQFGFYCEDCGTAKVVYFISAPNAFFKPGAYCYKHLLERCRRSRCIPYPITQDLLDKLQADMKIDPATKKYYIM